MKIKLRCYFIVSLITLSLGYTQEVKNQTTTDPDRFNIELDAQTFLDRTEFKLGYFGNSYWNPGLSGGAEYLLKERIRIKRGKRRTRRISNQFLLSGTVGAYWDPRDHIGVFTNYGLTWRRTNHKGKQVSITLNPIGFQRNFLAETYEVTNGEVNKVFLPGRNYYAPSLSVGLGKFRNGKKLTGRYLNLDLTVLAPYNTTVQPMISLSYGYRFKFKKKK